MPDSSVQKLKIARDKLAEVYEAEATDDIFDNGNLTSINDAILKVNDAIYAIEQRSD